MLAEQEKKLEEAKEAERAKMEAELREKLKAELMESMGISGTEKNADPKKDDEASE